MPTSARTSVCAVVLIAGLLPAAVATSTRSADAAPPHYVVSRYAPPPGTVFQYSVTYSPLARSGINASGTVTTVVVGARNGRQIAATLSPSRIAPSGNSYPTGINARGTVVGEFTPALSSYSYPALFRNGRAVLLGGGNFAYATGVNDADTVVGDELGEFDTPVIWVPGSIVPTPITATLPPGAVFTGTVAINNANAVLGNVDYPSAASGQYPGPVISNGNTWKPLPIGQRIATATAFNDAGVVVGYTGIPQTTNQAFVWDGAAHLIPFLPGTSSCQADYVNKKGDVTGYCHGPQFNEPFLLSGGTLYSLFSLVAAGTVPRSGIDCGLNDLGQILVCDDYQDRLFLFSPSGAAQPQARRQ